MKFDLTDGINNVLEYEVITHDNAVARVVEAFKVDWFASTEACPEPHIIFNKVLSELGIDLSFLSSYERMEIGEQLNDFLHSC